MKKSNILLMFAIFIVGVVIGILGTISFMDGEPKKATAPQPIEEKEQIPPVKEAAVPSVEEKEQTLPVEEVVVPSVEVEQKLPEIEKSPVLVQEKPIALKDQTDGGQGPFGVDSQKILPEYPWSGYKIGIVSNIDLEKYFDGTWYINKLEMVDGRTIYCTNSRPKQNDYKKREFLGYRGYKLEGYLLLENISAQSVDCKIDDISELSNPTKTMPTFRKKEDFVSVTGVIMAVSIESNPDPEPENPDNFQIHEAVMKCADGNLYKVEFGASTANLPARDAFGEGDVVTVMQVESTSDELESTLGIPGLYNRNYRTFRAYYIKGEKK